MKEIYEKIKYCVFRNLDSIHNHCKQLKVNFSLVNYSNKSDSFILACKDYRIFETCIVFEECIKIHIGLSADYVYKVVVPTRNIVDIEVHKYE